MICQVSWGLPETIEVVVLLVLQSIVAGLCFKRKHIFQNFHKRRSQFVIINENSIFERCDPVLVSVDWKKQ